MNDDLNRLQRQLEQATARTPDDQASLDPETAKLRETWTALGRLLDASQPAGQALLDAWKQPPPAPARRWHRLPALALAVSLAACAVAVWAWRGVDVPGPVPATTQQAAREAPRQPAASKIVAQRPASSTTDPQWDDKLDDQFARLGQRVIRVEQDWASQVVTKAVRQYQWDQVRQNVSADRL